MLNAISAAVILDQRGCIVATNELWRQLLEDLGGPSNGAIGETFSSVCCFPPQVEELIRLLLAGLNSGISPAYPCALSRGKAWYFLMGLGIPSAPERQALILLFDLSSMINSMGISFGSFSATSPPTPMVPAGRAEISRDLSKRQAEILQFLGEGSTNAEIAKAIGIAENTVKRHVTEILQRLGLRSRTEAAIYVRTHLSSTPADISD